MRTTYLEVTFRKGKPLAAYLYLPRREGDVSVRTERAETGLLIDYAADGRPIGIEITAPSRVSLESLNRVLAAARQAPATPIDLAPLAVN
ncbi:MAG TPA: DUF2283 domain-containing protein [Phycisphaerae bacterium]|jgi:uncharacterized protein YuzE